MMNVGMDSNGMKWRELGHEIMVFQSVIGMAMITFIHACRYR